MGTKFYSFNNLIISFFLKEMMGQSSAAWDSSQVTSVRWYDKWGAVIIFEFFAISQFSYNL